MAIGIPTGFVRKLYRILDHESAAIVGWDEDGASFSVHDSAALDAQVLPRYFRGRLSAFRQQLVDHGFQRRDCEETEDREEYFHPNFRRGCPQDLNQIERRPKKTAKVRAKPEPKLPQTDGFNGNLSLTVKLHVPPLEKRGKRSRESRAGAQEVKKVEEQEPTAKKPKNPLFTNDPESALSLATFMEGSGLLPASSELPDPISYLNKSGGETGEAQKSTAEMNTMSGPMFSDDMVKSALFFLVSSSCTGVEKSEVTTTATGGVPTTNAVVTATTAAPMTAPTMPTAATTSTSGFLASLLASSSTGGTGVVALPRSSNPLFNDQATDGDEDSIWNLLVASSVDRVRSNIDTVASPQEKLQLILQEREKLEEQRKKVGAPVGPLMPRRAVTAAAAAETSQPQKQQNPLFATDAAITSSAVMDDKPAEDDLWRLLMSSSIDSFRRVTDLGL